jgi:hypothetical protein
MLVCVAILFAAAFLHWQRTRHWCLLALTTGSLLAALGIIASLIHRILPVETLVETLPSGALRIDTTLLTVSGWLLTTGVIIGTVGGTGAIRWAIRLRQRRE